MTHQQLNELAGSILKDVDEWVCTDETISVLDTTIQDTLRSLFPEESNDTQHHERCIDHTTCDGMIAARDDCIHKMAKEIDEYRKALLPFAAAASRPGRLTDCKAGDPLPDDVAIGLGVKVAAWKRAIELTSAK